MYITFTNNENSAQLTHIYEHGEPSYYTQVKHFIYSVLYKIFGVLDESYHTILPNSRKTALLNLLSCINILK